MFSNTTLFVYQKWAHIFVEIEMWYFHNLRAYKGAAHHAEALVKAGHLGMKRALSAIRKEADTLIRLGRQERRTGKRFDPGPLWKSGAYTDKNAQSN